MSGRKKTNSKIIYLYKKYIQTSAELKLRRVRSLPRPKSDKAHRGGARRTKGKIHPEMARPRSRVLLTPRTRTVRQAAVQPSQTVNAADGFVVPEGTGKDSMVRRWWQPQAALVVQVSGSAMRVIGIRKKAGQATYFLRLARSDGVSSAQAQNADEDELKDASQYKQIIMGFVGGFFRTSGGIRVRVVETAGTGRFVEHVRVEAFAGGEGSASLGTTTHELQGFLQDITLEPWDESATDGGGNAADAPASISEYPGLQEVLQVAFGDPLPEQATLEAAMAVMADGQPGGAGSFAEKATALEAQVHTPGGQAGLTRLRHVQAAKLLPAAHAPEEVGLAIRRLVFVE